MEKKEKKSKKSLIILAIILVVGIVISSIEIIKYNKYEHTDDAQVQANISSVVSRISDYITVINFDDNEHVKKGQVLVRLDDKDLKIKAEQAQAALDNAKASVGVVAANVSSAGAMLDAAKESIKEANVGLVKAQQDFDRYKSLLADGSATQQQFDHVKAAKDAAEAQLSAAKKNVQAAQKKYDAAQEQVAVAKSVVKMRKAAVDFAQLELSYATITAPVSGVISKRTIQVGQMIQAGQPLFAVVSDSDVWIDANFKETQLADMRVGQPVNVEVDAYNGQVIHGTVNSFSGATGAVFSLLPPDNATGNFVKVVQRVPVKITLDKSNPLYKKLKPGLSVNISVYTAGDKK